MALCFVIPAGPYAMARALHVARSPPPSTETAVSESQTRDRSASGAMIAAT